MQRNQIKLLCQTALFTALVFVMTAYLHIPVGRGYVHMGDGLIFLAACLLPRPYAVGVGACGAFLADSLTGFLSWAPASVLIKTLTVLCFSHKGKTLLNLRNLCALLPAAVLCVGGYYVYEALLYGNWVSPLTAIPGNLLQSAASTALYVALALAIDRAKGKSKLLGESH